VDEIEVDVFCGDEDDNGRVCIFEGVVTARVNAELREWGWVCPNCGYEHSEDYTDFEIEEPYEEYEVED
jgi:hypothetical protein